MTHNYYENIIIAIDGIVYTLNGTEWTIVPNVPRLRELLWLNQTYLGITVYGELFSFKTGVIFDLGSPIISAYVINPANNLIMILLENGLLKIVHCDLTSNELVTVNSKEIDQEIPDFIVMLCPIYDELLANHNLHQRRYLEQPHQWLAITEHNHYLVLQSYNASPDERIDPYQSLITILEQVDNVWEIDNRQIKMLRNGLILTDSNQIYVIGLQLNLDKAGSFEIRHYQHNLGQLTEAIPLSSQVITLTSGGRLYSIIDNRIREVLIEDKMIHPIKFLDHYRLYDGSIRMSNNEIYVQGGDGGIYEITTNGVVTEQNVPKSLMTNWGRRTKVVSRV